MRRRNTCRDCCARGAAGRARGQLCAVSGLRAFPRAARIGGGVGVRPAGPREMPYRQEGAARLLQRGGAPAATEQRCPTDACSRVGVRRPAVGLRLLPARPQEDLRPRAPLGGDRRQAGGRPQCRVLSRPACSPVALTRRLAAWGGRPRLPVVLVTGLRDSHLGVTPDGDCASAGSMATLCQALTDRAIRCMCRPRAPIRPRGR
jgi:hypothetical protein